MYNAGTAVDPNSYTVCDVQSVGVTFGLVLTVHCGIPLSTRHIIIQSADTTAESLCLAEVVVGQYELQLYLY